MSARKSELGEQLAKGNNPLLVNSVEDFDHLLDFVFVERPVIPGPIKRYLTEHAIKNRGFNAKIFKDIRVDPPALESILEGVSAPTLIIWGDRDRLLDSSGGEILKSAMPNAELIVMKDTGHVPMVERPEDTARAFLEFQETVSSQ